MIVDTDVLIDYFRGKSGAEKTLAAIGSLQISVISYFELLQGIRNKGELKELQSFMKERDIVPLNFDQQQSLHCRMLMEKYILSHHLQMPDAMIAAACIVHNEELLTGNYKHFSFIKEITCKRYQEGQ